MKRYEVQLLDGCIEVDGDWMGTEGGELAFGPTGHSASCVFAAGQWIWAREKQAEAAPAPATEWIKYVSSDGAASERARIEARLGLERGPGADDSGALASYLAITGEPYVTLVAKGSTLEVACDLLDDQLDEYRNAAELAYEGSGPLRIFWRIGPQQAVSKDGQMWKVRCRLLISPLPDLASEELELVRRVTTRVYVQPKEAQDA